MNIDDDIEDDVDDDVDKDDNDSCMIKIQRLRMREKKDKFMKIEKRKKGTRLENKC